MKYTHRQRALASLEHKEPDRIPMDLGSTGNTGITHIACERLKRYLGIKDETPIINKALQLVKPGEEMLRRLDVDFRGLFISGPSEDVDILLGNDTYVDEWSVKRQRPEGSLYYDVIESPFQKGITLKSLESFNWPDPNDPGRIRGIKESADHYCKNTGYAIVMHISGGFITQSQYLRGFEGWLEDVLQDPELLGVLLDHTLHFQKMLTEKALDEAGEKVDIIHFGDDLGTQNGLMFSPQVYRKIIKPRQAELFKRVKNRSSAKIFYHTCGSVYEILEDLIEIGVDILNPLQHSARGMDCAVLKKKYGDRISFWGAVDTQHVLPKGDLEEVRCEVSKRIDTLAPGGGYVLNAVHNIQPDVPPGNICEMYDFGKAYGRYPL
jgi:uroporphyrinogen decarboxylase